MQSNKCLGQLQGQLYRLLEAHQSSYHWPWGVIKRSIKTTIIVTTARDYGNVYIRPPQHLYEVHRHFQKYSLLYYLFFCKEFPHIDFGIGDVVADTTPVTILRELFHHFHSQGFGSIWMHLLQLTKLYFIIYLVFLS